MAIRVPAELTERDPSVLAPAIGLTHHPDDQPGITRAGKVGDFSYFDAFGSVVPARRAAEIDALAIPPAWSDVWISPHANGYLQATGIDDAGRKQYRYHENYREFAEAQKFRRLCYFGRAVVEIRKAVAHALELPLGSREHAVAAAVRLIDEHLLRVGNHESAANGHYGATTLTVDHLVEEEPEQGLVLDYTAKSGATRTVVVDDDLADILASLAVRADDELFWFDDEATGNRRRATASDINDFIAHHGGSAFSARDFRTWGGSSVALASRVEHDRLLDAVDAAAEELGNTRAVARSSYIHPAVLDADDERIEAVWSSSRSSRRLSRAESALTKLLRDT